MSQDGGAATTISALAFLVREYDEAIQFFTQALLLAQATTPEQRCAVGRQAGGRVFMFLRTDHFQSDYEHMKAHGVHFCEEPRAESYGTVVVFLDLYGNKWDLIGPVSPG